ncbi:MAG: TolB family protein [Phycisphaerales bacterium]
MKTAAIVSLICASGMVFASNPNPNPEWDSQWEQAEADYLSNYQQLTFESKYIKAGESYFSPDGNMVIFQAIEVPEEGEVAEPHYAMYVATIKRDDAGNIIGIGQPGRVSKPGSANTCGWFHPTEPMTILFGTTTTPPSGEDVAGFQRKTSKYSWKFPVEMEIVSGELSMTYALSDEAAERAKEMAEKDMTQTPKLSMDDIVSIPQLKSYKPIWEHLGYDAEGSWSPDGRFVLYTQLEPGSANGDIYIYDTTDGSHTPLITAEGYDGGPFFSPDGKSICYRSDRRGDNMLQIFTAKLNFDEATGKVISADETQITDNEHVNWCPFYTPDGKYLLYATSEVSHGNYEVYAIDSTGEYPLDQTPRMRITNARGFDGLPAFTADGQWMIWTAQRGVTRQGEDRPSSQLWTAKIDLAAIDRVYQALRAEMIAEKNSKEAQEEMDEFESYTPGD